MFRRNRLNAALLVALMVGASASPAFAQTTPPATDTTGTDTATTDTTAMTPTDTTTTGTLDTTGTMPATDTGATDTMGTTDTGATDTMATTAVAPGATDSPARYETVERDRDIPWGLLGLLGLAGLMRKKDDHVAVRHDTPGVRR